MSDQTKMRAFFDALADSVEALSDEEVLAECREEGSSAADIATRTRAGLRDTIRTFRQRRLVDARRERERSITRMDATEHRLPADPERCRELLAAMMVRPEAQGMLTAHGREFAELTDVDVREALLELMYLGVDVHSGKADG